MQCLIWRQGNVKSLWFPCADDEPKWSAFRSQDFGFTKFKAFNGTHIYMEQVSVDLHGQVIDSMWLVKNKTVPFTSI
ncbi:hypothetical protein HF086_003826 [Spodoptera exigua]|uniref:Purple acid phosphatase C-terminal domain-containing protein n=1 Tax=Spodoptera exigua TaxID=7107 RepID=A0A922MXX4_SPOEX|nr:hypothetical protein HF086_003826 [Spodoptera exigua]